MHRLIKTTIPILALSLLAVTAVATTIDFSVIDEYHADGRIQRIGEAYFSHALYTHPDGFDAWEGGSYNFYGEQGESIVFDNPVSLNSIMLRDMPSLNATNPLYIEFFDAGDASLGISTLDLTITLTAYPLNVSGVKKMVFTFDGGIPFYDDGRDHAWYFIDDISFDIDDGTAAARGTWSAIKSLY